MILNGKLELDLKVHKDMTKGVIGITLHGSSLSLAVRSNMPKYRFPPYVAAQCKDNIS